MLPRASITPNFDRVAFALVFANFNQAQGAGGAFECVEGDLGGVVACSRQ
jgi:hypothetical protein